MTRPVRVAVNATTTMAPNCRAHSLHTDARTSARAGRVLGISGQAAARLAAAARGFAAAAGSDR